MLSPSRTVSTFSVSLSPAVRGSPLATLAKGPMAFSIADNPTVVSSDPALAPWKQHLNLLIPAGKLIEGHGIVGSRDVGAGSVYRLQDRAIASSKGFNASRRLQLSALGKVSSLCTARDI